MFGIVKRVLNNSCYCLVRRILREFSKYIFLCRNLMLFWMQNLLYNDYLLNFFFNFIFINFFFCCCCFIKFLYYNFIWTAKVKVLYITFCINNATLFIFILMSGLKKQKKNNERKINCWINKIAIQTKLGLSTLKEVQFKDLL